MYLRIVSLFMLLSSLALLTGCATDSRRIAPTKSVIDGLGLPLYPGAAAMDAFEAHSSSLMGSQRQISVMFETEDALDKVTAFYAAHLPTRARSIGIGAMHTFQFMEKNAQKQVVVVTVGKRTMIDLMTSWLMFGPQVSPSPK